MSDIEYAGDDRPVFAETVGWDAAQAILTDLELSDGLPLVPPTERRLAAMLADVAAPDRSYGMVPPMFGDLTAEAVAYQAVMAGCRPAELPVVLTAVEACLAPEFNLLGVATTTGAPAVATVVHGGLAERLGMNAGVNCLGPGNRANAAIGRAVALVLRNIGGARETTGDMATMGQPGKAGFCFAESDARLLPSLAERRGIEGDAVTVMAVSGTMEVLPLDDRDTPDAILLPVAAAWTAAAAVAGAGRVRPPGENVVLLPPEMVEAVAKHGWGLNEIRQFLYETAKIDVPDVAAFDRQAPLAGGPEDILPILTGGAGVKMTVLPLWAGGSATQTRAIRNLKE